ncbi:COG1361 S-layer family protein [Candidatus Woesearchaeota archaeon]|nr:COG1361 S-layer family protein [Candidatus Woesearchaeota archaeon]
MNKRIIMVLAMVLVSVVAAKAAFTSFNVADIRVTLVNQEPDPVSPGDRADLRFKFENRGSENAKDVTVEFIEKYPFTLENKNDRSRKIGSLSAQQTGDAGAVLKYGVRIDSDAIDGENEVTLRYRIGEGEWIQPKAFNISVQTAAPLLSIQAITIEKGYLEPGRQRAVNFEMKNMAYSLLRNVRLSLDLNNIPISPVGSTNERIYREITPREAFNVTYLLLADADAASKVYKVPLDIKYTDNTGRNQTQKPTVGLMVKEVPDFSVNLEETTAYYSGQKGKVVLSLSNRGASDIKYASMELLESEDYEILSAPRIYIGNLESDDFETVEFDVFLKAKKGDASLLVKVEYKDSFNLDHSKVETIPLTVYSKGDAKKYGLVAASSKSGFIVVLLIVAGAYFGYRKWWKNRKNPKK